MVLATQGTNGTGNAMAPRHEVNKFWKSLYIYIIHFLFIYLLTCCFNLSIYVRVYFKIIFIYIYICIYVSVYLHVCIYMCVCVFTVYFVFMCVQKQKEVEVWVYRFATFLNEHCFFVT